MELAEECHFKRVIGSVEALEHFVQAFKKKGPKSNHWSIIMQAVGNIRSVVVVWTDYALAIQL
jgi:hypothetical protein